MFIGWLRGDEVEKLKTSTQLFIDPWLLEIAFKRYPHYVFKVQKEQNIEAVALAYTYHKTTQLFFFENKISLEEKRKLLALLLDNLTTQKSLYSLVKTQEVELFSSFGFKSLKKVYKLINKGTKVAFNFSQTHAKEVNNPQFHSIAHKIDTAVRKEDRKIYLNEDMVSKSSLTLATNSGYLHSRAVLKEIFISSFGINSEAFMEAEKLLRAVLYYRGLKQIVVYAPDVVEILSLYEAYKFEQIEEYQLLYKGDVPQFDFDNMYAL